MTPCQKRFEMDAMMHPRNWFYIQTSDGFRHRMGDKGNDAEYAYNMMMSEDQWMRICPKCSNNPTCDLDWSLRQRVLRRGSFLNDGDIHG